MNAKVRPFNGGFRVIGIERFARPNMNDLMESEVVLSTFQGPDARERAERDKEYLENLKDLES